MYPTDLGFVGPAPGYVPEGVAVAAQHEHEDLEAFEVTDALAVAFHTEVFLGDEEAAGADADAEIGPPMRT